MPENYTLHTIWKNPVHFVACGFGAGTIQTMPGTWGTLVAVPFYLLLRHCQLISYFGLILLAFVLGVWICEVTEKNFGVQDPPAIVWDEMVGFWITMFLAPLKYNLYWIVIGFGLFRLFDIWKPWPIYWIDQKLSGGISIMMDDLLAGIYAWVILQVIIFGCMR